MPQSAAAFPYLSFFIAPQADVFHHDHNLSSCSSATHLSPLPLLAPSKLCHHNPLPQTAFPFASWTLEPHTLKHTLHCRHAFSSMSCPVSETRIQTHKRKHELINAIPPVTKQHHKWHHHTTMKYLLLVLALQFTGLSFSIPRFTKLILTDLMSHPQSRFFVHLY